MDHFGAKMAHPRNSGSALRIFFKILQNERGYLVHEIFIISFSRKKLIWGQFDLFSLFYCLIGHGQIKPGHC